MIHYICTPSMMDTLTGYAERNPDIAARQGVGRLPCVSLSDWVQLMVVGARSNGMLRLFLSDGREMLAHSITEELVRHAFPGTDPQEVMEALYRLDQARRLPLKTRPNLFAPLEQTAS